MKKNDFRRPSDSLLTHIFARSISARITPVIAKTPITPMQVTIVSLLFGICAAWIGSTHGWLYGLSAALLMELSHIFDCVDGELARLTGRGNPFAASMDPISDRLKDMLVIFAASLQSLELAVFNLTEFEILSVAFFSVSFWFAYLYIVDAFLNPARTKKAGIESTGKTRLYMGMYDLFIYGSIAFWIAQIFEYFIFYVLFLSILSIPVQLVRLKNTLIR